MESQAQPSLLLLRLLCVRQPVHAEQAEGSSRPEHHCLQASLRYAATKDVSTHVKTSATSDGWTCAPLCQCIVLPGSFRPAQLGKPDIALRMLSDGVNSAPAGCECLLCISQRCLCPVEVLHRTPGHVECLVAHIVLRLVLDNKHIPTLTDQGSCSA